MVKSSIFKSIFPYKYYVISILYTFLDSTASNEQEEEEVVPSMEDNQEEVTYDVPGGSDDSASNAEQLETLRNILHLEQTVGPGAASNEAMYDNPFSAIPEADIEMQPI